MCIRDRCYLGADSAGGAGGVQKRRAGRDLGALRERLQAEDEQRDRGSSERRRGRAARLRDSGGTQPPPEVVSPSGRLLPASPLACGHLTLLCQGAFQTLRPLRGLIDSLCIQCEGIFTQRLSIKHFAVQTQLRRPCPVNPGLKRARPSRDVLRRVDRGAACSPPAASSSRRAAPRLSLIHISEPTRPY